MKVKVSEVAILNRKQLQYKKRFDVIQYLDTSSVYKGKFDALQVLSVGVDDIPSRAQRAVKDGTIVISTVRPNLEHYGYFEYPSENVIVSSGFVTVDAIPEKVDSKYLYYVLTSPRTIAYLISISATAVSSYPSFNPEDLASFEIEIEDDIKEQKKIAESLSNIDSKISNNTAICSDLESMAKLLYDYWFVQFDFPDENGKPYKSSGGKMVWNEELKREIPEGWDVWQLGEHMTSARGVSYATPNLADNGIPMLNLASFRPDDTYNTDGIKYYAGKYEPSKVLQPYELIMCNTQQTALDPTKDIIGHCLLVPDIFDGDIISSHHVNHLIFDRDYLNYLVCGESKTVWFHKYMAGLSSGTNILGMDFGGVYQYKMVMPSYDVLKKFATMMHDFEARKSITLKENQQLSSFRDFLLPMLMNGQVKVK